MKIAFLLLLCTAAFAQQKGSFTDSRDGKKYKTLKIGSQTWMAENLNYQADSSWCYKNEAPNCVKYGRLYAWNAAMKACPAGWHLPTFGEWLSLVTFPDGKKAASTKFKSKSPHWDGTDDYGFSALPGGGRGAGGPGRSGKYDGHFDYLGSEGRWWLATPSHGHQDSSYAYIWHMETKQDYVGGDRSLHMSGGSSVRCLQGEKPDEKKAAEGNQKIEHITGTFTDARDGKKYRTIKLDDKIWMAENLNYQTDESWCYDNKASNCAKYGRLYNSDRDNACPAGWRMPSREEWRSLFTFVGGWETAGTKLKSKSPDWSDTGTDDYGFSAIPSGTRNASGSFYGLGSNGYWWAATGSFHYNIKMSGTGVKESDDFRSSGFSIRCLQP